MIFIIQQILPHYRYDVLKSLPQEKFRILFSKTIKEGSLESVEADKKNFIPIPIIKIGEKYFQFPFIQILKNKPDFVVVTPELRNLSFWIIFLLKFILGFKLVSWTHGINNKDYYSGVISTSGHFRMIMMRLSDQVITYSKDRAIKLRTLIKTPISVANNTLNTHSLDKVYKELNRINKDLIYNELGWDSTEIHFIYVGRLVKEKNIIDSIKLFKNVSEVIDRNSNLHIVGSGPNHKELESFIKLNNVNNVYFHGQIYDSDKLGAMLFSSHLHLHLGYNGLAVVHSLCFGCPIVTLLPTSDNGPYHSPEYEYLDSQNSIQGNISELVENVAQLISNPVRNDLLKQNARSTFENRCTIEQFLLAFTELEKTN